MYAETMPSFPARNKLACKVLILHKINFTRFTSIFQQAEIHFHYLVSIAILSNFTQLCPSMVQFLHWNGAVYLFLHSINYLETGNAQYWCRNHSHVDYVK